MQVLPFGGVQCVFKSSFMQGVVEFFLCTLVPRSYHGGILKHQYYHIVCLMLMFYHPIEVQTLLCKLFTYLLSMHVDPRSSHERTIRRKYYHFITPPLRKLVTVSPCMYVLQSCHYILLKCKYYYFLVHRAESLSPCSGQIK